MTKQELIDKLEKDPIEEYVYGTDVDPLVVEGKLNLILQYLKRPGDAEGTNVYLLDQFIKRLDFKENPQDAIDRLDGLIDSLDSTKADNDQLQAVINSLADKANVGTEKETTLSVSTLSEFQDHFYQLRKLPSRSYQYEVSSSLNLDLMDVLGWPNGNGNQAFIYVDLPYNESGGFEIDITYMERFHNNMYKRTMTSTNNGNWQDTGWLQYVSKADLTTLASKVETNTTEISKIRSFRQYVEANTKVKLETWSNIYLLTLGGGNDSYLNIYNKNNEKLYNTPSGTSGVIIFTGLGDYMTIISYDTNGSSGTQTIKYLITYNDIYIEPSDNTQLYRLI